MKNFLNKGLVRSLRAPVCIVLAYLLIAMNNVVVQMTSVDAHGDVFWRNLICCLLLVPFMIGRYGYESFYVEKELLWPLILRCIAGFLSILFLFYSLDQVNDENFAAVQILFFVSPVFTALFFAIVFGFRITKLAIVNYIVSFISIFALYSLINESDPQASFFALIAALATSVSAIFMVGLRTASSPLALVFYTCLFSCVMAFLLQIVVGWQLPNSLEEVLLLAVSGVQGLLIILFLTLGYRYASGSKLGAFAYSSFVFSVLSQVLFKVELPSVAILACSAVILVSGVLHYHFDRNPR